MDALLFLSVVLLAATQLIKMAMPQVSGWLTVIVVVALGILVAVIDVNIGLNDITIAQGIFAALGAVGIASAAQKAGGSA